MQKGKPEKPKVRLSRGTDGSLRLPGSADKADDLSAVWDELQQASKIQKPLKDELMDVSKSIHQSVKETAKKTGGHVPIKTSDDNKSLVVSIPKPHISKKIRTKKAKYAVATLTTLAVVAIAVPVFLLNGPEASKTTDTAANSQVKGAIETNVAPVFPTLTPLGKGVDDLGGYAKISPSGAPEVYAYSDAIAGVPIRVSQQKLPDNLREDQINKVKELANQFNANEQIDVGDGVAYVGTSIKGVQSVVYTKGENLVFIASDNIIANQDWVEYIGSLQY